MNENNNKEETQPKNIEEGVTREINLDELYDGAVNNTTIIDPITNNEILDVEKKPNYMLIAVAFAIIILLLLYYIHNKSSIGRKTKDVVPKTSIVSTTKKDIETGKLTCVYSSKAEMDSQTITYVLNYDNGVLINSTYNYVVISNADTLSELILDISTQYEDLKLKNNMLKSTIFNYEKNEKGFTFNAETKYKDNEVEEVTIEEGKTVLYVSPSSDDTKNNLQEKYESKGFNCIISD